jgi:hypothetical protein
MLSLLASKLPLNRKGCLEVFRGPYRGVIHLNLGKIVHAELFGKRGHSALYDLLQWEDITYKWYDDVQVEAPELDLSLEDLTEDSTTDVSLQDSPPVPELPLQLQEPSRSATDLYYQDTNSGLLERFVLRLDWEDAAGGSQNFTFEGTEQTCCIVGSSADAGIVIQHPSIEPLHCSLLIRADSVEIWDLGTHAKTAVNGEVSEQALLLSGDTLTLGDVRLLFSLGVKRRLSGKQPVQQIQTVPRPVIPSGGPIPKKAISYARLTGQKTPSPGLSRTLKKMFFRTTNRIRKP